jgi:hypothetical protein
MILTEKSLRQWEESAHICFSAEEKTEILARFGTEPGDGNAWSEQDVAEQIRKMRH